MISNMALKMSSVVKQLMYVKNYFELRLAVFTLSGSLVKKRFGSCVQSTGIHLCCGSFGSIICLWIKNPDLDLRVIPSVI